jgi:hypothetical protein
LPTTSSGILRNFFSETVADFFEKGYAMDLGYIQGYLPLNDTSLAADPVRSGLILTFTEGLLHILWP